MDFSDFLEELNIALGDSDDFTYTPEEKTRALTEAFNDPYAVTNTWNTTLTFTNGTYQYPLPSGTGIVKDIYIKADNQLDYPEKIDSGLWEVVGTNIQFLPGSSTIPTGFTLYVKGANKITVADTVTDIAQQEYILTVAQFRCLKLLGNKKINRFLKNDTTLAELITLKRDLQQDMMDYRKRIPRGYEVA